MQYYDLRRYQLRNGVAKRMLPAKPTGTASFGAFAALIGDSAPFLMTLQAFDSFAEAESAPDLDFDYVGYERTLLRSCAALPAWKLPPLAASGHVFELRTYRSYNASTLRKKLDMFANGELAIFLRLGIAPVFLGEALAGGNLPHLTYLLCYDDLPARDRLWKAFGADPEWSKLRSTPGLTDADLVANISNAILRPTDISDIR
jgi:hypothetical protein